MYEILHIKRYTRYAARFVVNNKYDPRYTLTDVLRSFLWSPLQEFRAKNKVGSLSREDQLV